MKTILLIGFALVAAAAVWTALFFIRKRNRAKTSVYVCDHCGEHHCDCRPEK